jgi:hypothetical protein
MAILAPSGWRGHSVYGLCPAGRAPLLGSGVPAHRLPWPMPQTPKTEALGGDSPKPSKESIRARVAHESERRARLGVPAIAGGVLYLLGGIIVSATLKLLPTVGAIQGLAPALRGEANPAISPGTAEVRYISHHAFGLIAGNAVQALAILFIVAVLLFLYGAIRFRRPEASPVARLLVLIGGAVMVLVTVAHPTVQAVDAHNFATGHDFTPDAVSHALTRGALLEITEYLGLLGGLTLAAGTVVVALGAARTGLLPRWMMYLGVFVALVAFTPFGLALGSIQQLVPAFWMVGLGFLLMGRWPGGDPPAWAAGEARPWPSSAEVRAARDAARGAPGAKGEARRARSREGHDAADPDGVAPEPVQPAPRAGSRRRRKRGARG